jgi:hypothetical protein
MQHEIDDSNFLTLRGEMGSVFWRCHRGLPSFMRSSR